MSTVDPSGFKNVKDVLVLLKMAEFIAGRSASEVEIFELPLILTICHPLLMPAKPAGDALSTDFIDDSYHST